MKLSKGETVPAKIIGVSTRTDLAVLKISSRKKVPFLRFADSEKVKIGHYAIAIGSPFSLSQTMTTGIVSYKGRELGLHYREDYIQTDAAISPPPPAKGMWGLDLPLTEILQRQLFSVF